MGLSSLIVSNNRKHTVVVFIGLVLTLKIALISAVNEESQVRYKLSIFAFFIRQSRKGRGFNFEEYCYFIFLVDVIFRFTRFIWVGGNMMILILLLNHIMIFSDHFLEGNQPWAFLLEDHECCAKKYWFMNLNVFTDDAARKLPVSL